jgi:hypothetical protein
VTKKLSVSLCVFVRRFQAQQRGRVVRATSQQTAGRRHKRPPLVGRQRLRAAQSHCRECKLSPAATTNGTREPKIGQQAATANDEASREGRPRPPAKFWARFSRRADVDDAGRVRVELTSMMP